MTVTIEDKIEMFSKLIYGNIEAQSSDKRQKLTETYNQELEKLKTDVQKKKEEMLELASAKAERERKKLLAQTKNQQQHKLVELQQQSVQTVMQGLIQRVTAFVDTPEYQAYFQRNVSAAFEALSGSKHIDLYVAEKDLSLCRTLAEQENSRAGIQKTLDIKPAAKGIIGGLIAEDSDNQLQLDLTLRSIIEEKRDLIGTEITRKFNEVNNL